MKNSNLFRNLLKNTNIDFIKKIPLPLTKTKLWHENAKNPNPIPKIKISNLILILRSTVSDSAGYINKLKDQVEKSKIASGINNRLNSVGSTNKSLLKSFAENEETLHGNADTDSQSTESRNNGLLKSEYVKTKFFF